MDIKHTSQHFNMNTCTLSMALNHLHVYRKCNDSIMLRDGSVLTPFPSSNLMENENNFRKWETFPNKFNSEKLQRIQ